MSLLLWQNFIWHALRFYFLSDHVLALLFIICYKTYLFLGGHCFYFLTLNSFQGYRVISIDIPCVWNHQEWIQAFEKFLDAIDVHHVRSCWNSCDRYLTQSCRNGCAAFHHVAFKLLQCVSTESYLLICSEIVWYIRWS